MASTKTYRLFSAIMLMLFFSSIVLPSGISAATLFCDMPMAEMHNSPQNCCDIDSAEETTHHRGNPADEDCNDEKICLHILSPDQTEVDAIVVQQAKKLTAIAVSSEIDGPAGSHRNTNIEFRSPVVPNDSPPIFLLNSTFLN